jgi:periplasmic protein TonB
MGAGLIASVLLHGGLIAAFIVLRAATPPPAPPIYRVQLYGAPPTGTPAIGTVQPAPPPAEARRLPPPAIPPRNAPRAMPAPKPKTPLAKPTAQPKQTTPIPPVRTTEPPPSTAPAAASREGGKGADVANVDTPGLEFPYQPYINNIERQILLRFTSPSNRPFTAEVRFIIRRDGSVDPESISLSKSSGSYAFNQAAIGAVDAASNAKAFGPLPTGFREDILPVTFRFNPSGIR